MSLSNRRERNRLWVLHASCIREDTSSLYQMETST